MIERSNNTIKYKFKNQIIVIFVKNFTFSGKTTNYLNGSISWGSSFLSTLMRVYVKKLAQLIFH